MRLERMNPTSQKPSTTSGEEPISPVAGNSVNSNHFVSAPAVAARKAA